MIIMIGGAPCSGKSTLVRSILSELGSAENVEPMKLFSCQKHNDILVVGRYPEEEAFGGTDRLSYGTISKFRKFIIQEYSKYKHIIIEGDRFFRMKDIEWLVSEYNAGTFDAKIFVLTVSSSEEQRRHIERQDTQSEKWLKGRRSQINNILTNMFLMDKIQVRNNENKNDMMKIEEELKDLLLEFMS